MHIERERWPEMDSFSEYRMQNTGREYTADREGGSVAERRERGCVGERSFSLSVQRPANYAIGGGSLYYHIWHFN